MTTSRQEATDELRRLVDVLGAACKVDDLAEPYAAVIGRALQRGDELLGAPWQESRRLAEAALRTRTNLEAVELALRLRYGPMNALSKRFQIAAALLETYSPESARAFKATGSRMGRLWTLAVHCLRVPWVVVVGAWTLRRLQRASVHEKPPA